MVEPDEQSSKLYVFVFRFGHVLLNRATILLHPPLVLAHLREARGTWARSRKASSGEHGQVAATVLGNRSGVAGDASHGGLRGLQRKPQHSRKHMLLASLAIASLTLLAARWARVCIARDFRSRPQTLPRRQTRPNTRNGATHGNERNGVF